MSTNISTTFAAGVAEKGVGTFMWLVERNSTYSNVLVEDTKDRAYFEWMRVHVVDYIWGTSCLSVKDMTT